MNSAETVQATDQAGWRLEHSYTQLPDIFHSAVQPTAVATPRLLVLNVPLARELGLEPAALDTSEGARIFAGNALPPGAAPIAQAYAGHQFGHFTRLGDGRAILLGEQVTPAGLRFDIQLKGSGPTPYSRRGDGRAAIGPMLREYLISEAMHALNIPTTRSLAVVATGETVYRQEALPGAVLTRVAGSHIRVGTFEWAATRGDESSIRALAEYTLRRHYPELVDEENPPLALLSAVIERQAKLIAQWMLVGFVHGVMNTDNMALSGETIDYGPCAFLDAYDPATVFSSIDENGRYAYGNQPQIAQWNLTRLAEALLPVLAKEEAAAVSLANEALSRFGPSFERHWFEMVCRKLGLTTAKADDASLISRLFAWMQKSKADFTQTFADLSIEPPILRSDANVPTDDEFALWKRDWTARLEQQSQPSAEARTLMQRHNPVLIPRNHLVETALAAAGEGNMEPFFKLLNALQKPFDQQAVPKEFRCSPPTDAGPYRTFCGT